MSKSLQVWTLLLLVTALVRCDYNSTDICGWERPRASLIRDHIYLEGGLLSLAVNGSCEGALTAKPSTGLLFNLSLHEPFDRGSEGSPAGFKSIFEGSISNYYLDGFMFADYDEFYAWGGMYVTAGDTKGTRTVTTPLYDPPEGSNVQLGLPNTDYAPNSGNFVTVTNGAGANAPGENLGFYLGGFYNQNGTAYSYFNPPTDQYPSLIRVDTTIQSHAEWTELNLNESITPWRSEGALVWVPISTQGVLIAIGGVVKPADLNQETSQDNATQSIKFVKEFLVYDIGTNTSELQLLDSSSPFPDEPLAQFCTVVASSANSSHHEIFVYGGNNGNTSSVNGDVWILTVPSFTWIKAEGKGRAGDARQGHSCISPYPDQMIVIGGTLASARPLGLGKTVDVYNLNDLNWTGTYDPDVHQEYRPHASVENVVSDISVADTMNPRVSGWFNKPYNKDKIRFFGPYERASTTQPSPTPAPGNTTVPGESPTSTPAPSGDSGREWVTPVAASLSSVGGLVILGALFLFCCLQKRKQHVQADEKGDSVEGDKKSFIVPWLWASSSPTTLRGVGSDTNTEAETAHSPPAEFPPPQELGSDGGIDSIVGRGSIQSGQGRWSSSMPPRAPLGEFVGIVEGPDTRVHEVSGTSRPGLVDQINYDPRNMSHYPPSFFSEAQRRGIADGSISPNDASQDPSSPVAASVVPSSDPDISAFPGGNLDHEQRFGPFGAVDRAISPLTSRQLERPQHRRHDSSISSGMSFPSPDNEQSPLPGPRYVRSLSGPHGSTALAEPGSQTR